MRTCKLAALAAVPFLIVTGCASEGSSAAASSAAAAASAAPVPTPTPDPVRVLMDGLTLEEKVGQLFIVRPESLFEPTSSQALNVDDEHGMTAVTDDVPGQLEKYPVGGVCLFSKNIIDPDQLNAFMASWKAQKGIPLFLAVDEEGGTVARIGNNPNFDVPHILSMQKVGASNDWNDGYAVGSEIGTYLKQYGFNVDFAPDADVNTNPDNPVIGNRAFSSDPGVAANMVNAAVTGFHDAGMMTCLKHFPGHGDTSTDTHSGYAATARTWAEMEQCEMLPFESGIQAGTDFIMAAHITSPNASDDGMPASMSRVMLTDRLRGELGYQGIIITDAMDMAAISNYYSSAEAAVTAISAGADIILIPHDLADAYQGILDAVRNGTLTEERIDESVYRILSAKMKYGVIAK